MLNQFYSKQFKKDVVKSIKRGKDIRKLEKVIELLSENIKLPAKYKDHALVSNYRGRRDCHIEPDWLLIYKQDGNDIFFERTGSHSDLFG
jgi:mRNA interferase YafQ